MAAAEYLMYQYRNSRLEMWDPRAKIIATLLLGLALLISDSFPVKGAMFALLIGLWGVARLPWRMLLIALLSLTLLFASTMIYHTLLLHSEASGFRFQSVGVWSGLTMCLQIAGLVLLLALLVRTTAPLVLAEGLELLLAPLKRWKLPIHEAVLMFSIALQFIPILLAEFDLIRKAQVARGGGFHHGNILRRFRGVLPILMPMIIRSIQRAEELATAMEARCYNGGDGRTSLREYSWRSGDTRVLACSIGMVAVAVADRIWL